VAGEGRLGAALECLLHRRWLALDEHEQQCPAGVEQGSTVFATTPEIVERERSGSFSGRIELGRREEDVLVGALAASSGPATGGPFSTPPRRAARSCAEGPTDVAQLAGRGRKVSVNAIFRGGRR